MKPLRIAAAFLVLGLTAKAHAQAKVVVPAFFDLGTTTRRADWQRIADAGSGVAIVVALGGSGGFEDCGSSTLTVCQTDSIRSAARTQFAKNTGKGQLVLGYVDSGTNTSTGNGMRTVQAIEAEIDKWQALYANDVDGIFLDDGPYLLSGGTSDGTFESNSLCSSSPSTCNPGYGQLYSYVHALTFRGHAGKVMVNASQFPNSWIVSDPAADYVNVFEATFSNWIDQFPSKYVSQCLSPPCGVPTWWSTYAGATARVSQVVYGVPDASPSGYYLPDLVRMSRDRGSPMLYLYDGTSRGYDHLPSWFEKAVTATAFCSGTPSLTYDLEPRTITIQSGHTGTATLHLTNVGEEEEFDKNLGATNLPSGASISFSPNPATSSGDVTLTISVPSGNYSFTAFVNVDDGVLADTSCSVPYQVTVTP